MSDQKEKMEPKNLLTVKEFESAQMTHELIKSAEEEVSEIHKVAIKVENDLDSKEFEVTPVFIKNENGQLIDTNAIDTVWDSTTNFTETWIKCEAVEGLKLENGLDTETCGITGIREEYIIKNENDHILKHPMVSGSYNLHVCIHCNATFRKKTSLDGHIYKKHPDFVASISSKIHVCAHCAYGTTRKEHLVNHMSKHSEGSKPNVCIHCNRTYKCKKSLDDHMINKHPEYITSVPSKIHECQYCVFKTVSKCNLSRHMGKHPEAKGGCEPKMCIHCHAKFKSKTSLDDHLIKKHPKFIAYVTSKIHECKYCVFKTTSKTNLHRHMGKHPGAEGGCQLETCIHCNRTFSSKMNLHDHIVRDHPGYITTVSSKVHECIYCAYKTTSANKFTRHMLKHLGFSTEASSKMHECAHCTYKSNYKSTLTRHMLTHSGEKRIYKLKKCVHCNSTFKAKMILDNHIIKKHPDFISSVSSKIHECTYCTYKTTFKGRLAIHMLKHPEAKSSYKLNVCTLCNRTFINKINLNDHVIKEHPEHIGSVSSKIHECEYCVFITTSKGYLAKHMQMHAGEKGDIKTCIHCNATFKCEKKLDNHIIKEHPDLIASVSSKIYECTHCPFRTTEKYYLSKHILKHSEAERGSKLKKCVHCNATFSTKTLLGNHIIFKHPEFIASVLSKIHECTHCTYKTTVKGSLAIHMLKHSGATSHKLNVCIHCNATFKNKNNLNDHIIKKHPEHTSSVSSKILECKYCAFKTTSKSYLTRHIGKHPEAEGGYALKTCIHCNATFKSKGSLDNHTVMKHPEYIASVSSKVHECKYCVFKTTLKDHLAKHMRKHPGAESELKTCIHCNATFKSKNYLDNHIIKKHPGYISSISSKIHECTHCTYKTTVKRDFDGHLRKTHMGKHPGADGSDSLMKNKKRK